MLALDLIGVKVFRYSDETAEAVASGEKLLKESGTIKSELLFYILI